MMASTKDLAAMELRQLVTLARDRHRDLGKCIHPDWSPYVMLELVKEDEALAALDGEELAAEVGVLAAALEARRRTLDAACCHAQVGSFFSKYSPYFPEGAPVLRHIGIGVPVPESLSHAWGLVDHHRAAPCFGRAGLLFRRALEELGDGAGPAVKRRLLGNAGAGRVLTILRCAREEAPELELPGPAELLLALHPLWCARGVLYSAARAGPRVVRADAVELLAMLRDRWAEWMGPLVELEARMDRFWIEGPRKPRLAEDLCAIEEALRAASMD